MTVHLKNAIGEIDPIDAKQVKRVVLCSSKVYYDLLEERRKREIKDVAIVRIEQLYPHHPHEEIKEILSRLINTLLILFGVKKNRKTKVRGIVANIISMLLYRKGAKLRYAGRRHLHHRQSVICHYISNNKKH